MATYSHTSDLKVGVLGRSDTLATGLVWAIACSILILTMPYNMGLYDEGIIFTDAMRILAGDVIHRDFYANYGPFQYYIMAAIFRISDGSFLAGRFYDVACKALVCALLFYIVLHVAGRLVGLLVAAASALWFIAFPVFLYSIYPCMALGVLATYLMVPASIADGSRSAAAAAGISTGAAALVRYDVGFLLLIANLAGAGLLIWRDAARGGALRRYTTIVVTYGLGTSLVFIPAAVAFLIVAPLGSFWHDIIEYPTKYYAEMRGLPFPRPWVRDPNSLYFVPIRELCAVYFAPLVAGIGLVEAWRIGSFGGSADANMDRARIRATLVLFSLCTLFLFLKGIVRVSALHMLLCNMPALVVAATLAWRWLKRSPIMQAGAVAALVLVIVPPATFASDELKKDIASPDRIFATLIAKRAGLSGGRGGGAACSTTPRSEIATYPADYVRVANFIARRTTPDERIFVALDHNDKIFINPMALYFATGRLPGTHWHQFDPGLQNRADNQAAIVADLKTNRVRWVVRDGSIENPNEPNGSSKSSGVTLLDDYLDANYRPVASSGRVAVWLLKGVPTPVSNQPVCEATAIN